MTTRPQVSGETGFAIAYSVASAAATIAGAFGSHRAAAVTKPVPLALLAGRAAWRARRRLARPGIDDALLAGAIVFSAAGDRAMLLEEFSPADTAAQWTAKDRRLATGAALFAAGQLGYCGLLFRRGARPSLRAFAPRIAALSEAAAVLATHRPRPLTVLMPYGTTLAMMSTLADNLDTPQPSTRVGGLLFLASDFTILNRRHLIRGATARRVSEAWVLASYFTAQYLLTTAPGTAPGPSTSPRVARSA
ncbi:lysoplasmalogenase [Gordonia otitidis]|uniref:lysoplasmalogenase family protein n=1 Tax=Gordonia otitidis TaxID=249058 RepID=UPI001D14357B|nr:lysoplasmalogenase family protein [Gordonia otitidis]UEA58391.1 lysoplasmalogenase [Gordonia otitidis]